MQTLTKMDMEVIEDYYHMTDKWRDKLDESDTSIVTIVCTSTCISKLLLVFLKIHTIVI